jgi:1-acyl-sn-glycerol-3-phosphate acyltransferase
MSVPFRQSCGASTLEVSGDGPEGRSKTASLQPAWTGASYLAAKADVPVLPVAVFGTEDAQVKAQLKRLRRANVIFRVGKPFLLPPLPKNDREAYLQHYTDEMMCQIAALLPQNIAAFTPITLV